MDMNSSLEAGAPSIGRFAPPMHRFDSNPRLVLKTRTENFPHSSSPAPPSSGHPILHSNGLGSRRQRPETSHQKAVNMNRKMRVDHILHKQIGQKHNSVRIDKKRINSSFGLMVMNRVKDLPDMYDTDDDFSWGPGGLVPNPHPHPRSEDYGEEALAYKKAIDRAVRRLYREENGGSLGGLAKSYRKAKRRSAAYADDEGRSRKRRKDDGSRGVDVERDEEALDDLDRDLLGEGREDDDEMDEDSRTDETEGEDGELTEDEVMNEV